MKENDEIRMTNAESTTKSECCGALSRDGSDLPNIGYAKVERVVLNALQKTAALPPDICAFGDHAPIVFREADPPWIACRLSADDTPYDNNGSSLLRAWSFGHSFVIRHSSFVIFPHHGFATDDGRIRSKSQCLP